MFEKEFGSTYRQICEIHRFGVPSCSKIQFDNENVKWKLTYCLCSETEGYPAAKALRKTAADFSYRTAWCYLILCLSGCHTSTNSAMQDDASEKAGWPEANKALARRWFEEVINARNPDAVYDIYSVDYVYHGPGGMEMRDLDSVRAFAVAILAASDDRHAVVQQQVAEGDLVVTRFTSVGHHTGPYQGLEATGKIWTTEGIDISRIAGGKIVEGWEVICSSEL